ncbi:putative ATP-dependent RNA helicase DDX52 [Toxocara canis]|uniref:ATP-dependent RNA helicase n=1 Tax=Toxocara canis TaxID=6265 RepID=A0A0B2VUD2_TOXCA|nr:putative ATP-dependent RNA helicase DDX52 [Toxocara canis]
MLDRDSQEEVFKTLSFGVKKTKLFKERNSSEGSAGEKLRIRVLPDEDDATATVTNRSENAEQDEQDAQNADEKGPELLGGSGLSLKFRKQRKKLEERKCIIHAEKMNRLRKLNRIYTWGDGIPDPFINFADISGVPQELLNNLDEFGIKEPSPIQMQTIPIMRQRRELLASAPTGSGKTLAFAIPIILEILRLKKLPKYEQGKKLLAVVLEPTRELSKQTYMQFMKFGQNLPISCALMEEDTIQDNVDVIVSTPNRIAYFVESNASNHHFKWLRWLIVDESDRLFETTEGDARCFRNQLAKVYQACNGKYTHHAFFSATFSYEVEEWCKTNLHDVAMVCIGARNLLRWFRKFFWKGMLRVVSFRELLWKVMSQSKDRARQLTSEISGFDSHIPVALISSEKSEKERDNTIAKFRGGSVWVLVCTELAGRGLDLKGVNLVINFDLPTSVYGEIRNVDVLSRMSEEIFFRRTGRAGRRGRAITYFTEKDMDMIRPIATVISQAGFPVPEYTLRVRKLTRKERKGLLRRPPKRKNVGAVKKRFIKPSPTKQTGNHAVDKNLATDLNSAKIIEKLNKRKLDYSEKDRGKRLKRKKIVESESN